MYCKSCGNNCNENAIACTSCGIPPKKGKSFCGDCGEKTNENAIICVKCGSSLSGKKIKETKKVDTLKDIKSFSTLKKFTIFSVLFSIVLLFIPWLGDINPINLVEFKNDLFDIVDIDDLPLSLNLFFYFGYITILFLVVSLFKIYKSDYRFASLLQFLNIVALVLVIASNIFYSSNGEYENWIEDEVDERYSEKYLEHEYEECLDDYGIDAEEYKRHPFRMFKFTSILFVILFLTNWILIARLSRRKRLESIK
jgi:hypothetical protein